MRYAALLLAMMLAACGRGGFHMTDVSGAMPRLDFHLTRAGDGQAVTGESYHGKVVILYFGYTNCPGCLPGHLGQSRWHAGQAAKQGRAAVVRCRSTLTATRLPVLKRYVQAFSSADRWPARNGQPTGQPGAALPRRPIRSIPRPPYTVMHSNAVFILRP